VTVVVDASTVVAALADAGPAGSWAEERLRDASLAAPHLMPVEVANILRRAAVARDLSPELASLAHADLLDMGVTLYPYEPFAARVWELRHNLSAYDAWYVALAEALDAPLATLDVRLAAAPGPGCTFVLPP
jgi:predicted nucleic acid-binding protein